jgi:glyoxalase-like protein
MFIRQIALVARDLEPVVADLRAVFGLQDGFPDPGVAEFGLHNVVMAVGTTFLEVVSPVRPGTTAGRFLDKQGGDGGYMVILQTTDLDADRRRLAALGVRIVWEITLDDIATVHLHPRDIGGAIVSLDQPRPPTSWRWGGPGWEARTRTDIVRAIASVTLAAADPDRLASRWAAVLGLSASRGREIALDRGSIRFVGANGHPEGIVAVGLAAADVDAALAAARARGLRTDGCSVWIGGVRFDLEDSTC